MKDIEYPTDVDECVAVCRCSMEGGKYNLMRIWFDEYDYNDDPEEHFCFVSNPVPADEVYSVFGERNARMHTP